MSFSHVALVLLAGSFGCASAQLYAGVPGSRASSSSFTNELCNQTFQNANASGVVTLQPNVGFADDAISWAATVFQSNASGAANRTELSLWFSPGGKNYSNDFELGYDVCYLTPQFLKLDTFLRGQNDNGNCLETFDNACVTDLTAATSKYSSQLTGDPTGGNLNASSLPGVCSQLASLLTQNFPQSCMPYFNATANDDGIIVFGAAPALGGALTGSESLLDSTQCSINKTYSLMWTQYGPATEYNYLVANYYVAPIITAFMPIANLGRPVTLGSSASFMSCLRANTINKGSREVLAAPTASSEAQESAALLGTPLSSATASASASSSADSDAKTGPGINASGIGGIVVSIIIVGLVFAGAVYFCIRRQRKIGSIHLTSTGMEELDRNRLRQFSVEAPENAVAEMGTLSPTKYRSRQDSAEVGGSAVSEMDNLPSPAYNRSWKGAEPYELPGGHYSPVELDSRSRDK